VRAVICNPPSEIPNPKHQITNKSQITICNDPNIFGILFFKTDVQVWDFEFKKENELNSNSEFRILKSKAVAFFATSGYIPCCVCIL